MGGWENCKYISQLKPYIDDVFTEWNGENDGSTGISNYCGEQFPLLSAAIRGGLFHPNCRHTMSLYVHGQTKIPEPIPEEKIKKQRELEQHQRYLERKIRRYKRLEAGTMDAEQAKVYTQKRKQAQAELKAFIAENDKALKRDYFREKVYEGTLEAPNNNNKNFAKTLDLFDDYSAPSKEHITTEQIVENLKTSEIGKEYLKYIEELPERIKLDYISNEKGIYGENSGNSIVIYMKNNNSAERVAMTIIHEVTHYRYGISNSQWAECVCISHELMHKYDRKVLTIAEKKRIIKAVKEAYDNINWRKGGFVNGRRKNH
ncbi:MAG: phage minor capsid protein [Ruminococcus sp.]|nr:phage minor capsid protein [Ruminococcus sp.]